MSCSTGITVTLNDQGSKHAMACRVENRYLSKSINSFFISLRGTVHRVSTKISQDYLSNDGSERRVSFGECSKTSGGKVIGKGRMPTTNRATTVLRMAATT